MKPKLQTQFSLSHKPKCKLLSVPCITYFCKPFSLLTQKWCLLSKSQNNNNINNNNPKCWQSFTWHMGIVMTQIPCCVPSGEMPSDWCSCTNPHQPTGPVHWTICPAHLQTSGSSSMMVMVMMMMLSRGCKHYLYLPLMFNTKKFANGLTKNRGKILLIFAKLVENWTLNLRK